VRCNVKEDARGYSRAMTRSAVAVGPATELVDALVDASVGGEPVRGADEDGSGHLPAAGRGVLEYLSSCLRAARDG
jgi:hypothetical protein